MPYIQYPEMPGNFERLDTRVNAADSFANQRDLQQLRLNHNILLSRRVRRPIFTTRFTDDHTPLEIKTITDEYLPSAGLAMLQPITVTAGTKELVVKLRAEKHVECLGNLTARFFCYPLASPTAITNSSVSVTSNAENTYSVTVGLSNVPTNQNSVSGRGIYLFGMACKSEIETSDLKVGPPDVVTDAGPNWVSGASTAQQYNMIYFPSRPDIEPRVVIQRNTGTVWVAPNWNAIPVPGDTIQYRRIFGLELYSLSVYENGQTIAHEIFGSNHFL